MLRQVITIAACGAVSGLQRKPGQGLDLTTLGKAEVRRASEILWDEDHQAWYVQPLGGDCDSPLLTQAVTGCSFQIALGLAISDYAGAIQELAPSGFTTAADGRMLFRSYDEAVRVEIAYLDALRLKRIH